MFRKVSVLVPTRKRVQILQRLLTSWDATVADPASAELVFRVDDDDDQTQEFLRHSPWTVVVGPRHEGYRSLLRFFDEARRAGTGDLFMIGNDDMVFHTTDWPRLLCAHADRFPDGLFDLGVRSHNSKVFPFGCTSRVAVEALGFIADPRLFWADVYLRDVFAHFGRAIRVDDVHIDHVWMGFTPDETFIEGKQHEDRNWNEAYWAFHRQCVAEAVAKLEAADLLREVA